MNQMVNILNLYPYFSSQKRLDAEAKQLHSHASNFARQTQQWLGLVDNFNSALKELGDVDSWSR